MSTTGLRVLAIVSPGGSAIETVDYALREARDVHAELDLPVVVEVLLVASPEESGESVGLRTRIEAMLATFEAGSELHARLDVLPVESDDPVDRTEALLARFGGEEPSRVVVDAGSDVPVAPLREAFGVARVELAPSGVPDGRRRLVHPGGIRRLGTIFGLTYLFYLAVGGFAPGLDLLTGAISAGIVALSLSHVALREEPTLGRTGGRLARLALFLPVLLWEIVKANVAIAYVILHPRLPIDPSMGTLDTATEEGLERMVLANSITLTPGTLAIDVRGSEFTVHSLTSGAREELEAGRLEGLVAWIFHGKRGANPPSDGGREA